MGKPRAYGYVHIVQTKPKIGRHKKKMDKHEKRSYKKYRGQGR
jgi:hypothetical protein